MRLSHEQVRVIRDVVEGQIGESARVYLFGSRVDDAARGGDIDLYQDAENAGDGSPYAPPQLGSTAVCWLDRLGLARRLGSWRRRLAWPRHAPPPARRR